MSYRDTEAMLYQELRGVNGTCEHTVVWNSWSRRYAPHLKENMLPVGIIRRLKAPQEDTCTELQTCCVVRGALGLE